ncbi:EAL domain-containing protein [Roseomonas sp. ACRSG]|nr:EAL domain-containing protein [Roseomonas sp. ACRSG]
MTDDPVGDAAREGRRAHPSQGHEAPTHHTQPGRWADRLVIILACVVIFAIASHLELFELIFHFTRQHEEWQLDELVTLLMVGGLGLCVYSFRQARKLQREIGRRRDAEEEAERLALHDVLTGLPNRRQLIRAGRRLLARARRSGTTVAALYIDLDRFKPVNDLLGHHAGDQVLQEVGNRLKGLVREGDVVARLGGDEFALLAEIDEADGAARLARRVVQALRESMTIGDRQVVIGGSVGIALFPNDTQDGETLLQCADTAMYRAKAAGRGGFRFFEVGMDTAQRQRAQLEAELREGIARGEVVPYFQPLVDLSNGRPRRFEVLARWHHPWRGLIMPADFVPLAEDAGLIGELTLAIMRSAFTTAAAWPAPACIAVNLSALQLKDPGLAQVVLELLRETGLDPGRLELEVTESAVADNLDLAKETMDTLKAEGVSIALDDFGTGYSSLSNLRALPFDRIKIDRSFVTDLNENSDSGKLVAAIIRLGHSLGLTTTAEGIEDPEVAAALLRLGCNEGQGWLYGKAVPARDANAMMQAMTEAPLQGAGRV